ncbi:cysteine-rich receptor-like protein kinase 25 [Neltuma alba]|uniref:cysteine-rich receptor-like protein kinase 25 n=1 Tax=Neltuma alba TaxID=207710 RepID=UPI0010A4A6C2|nr:cysteine-rich receptor-like protein kinase 25 [Prosopis alba]
MGNEDLENGASPLVSIRYGECRHVSDKWGSLTFFLSYSNTNQDAGFYCTSVAGQENNPNATVYGMFQCLGDITVQTCQKCVSYGIKDILQRCPNNTGATGCYDKCWLRYSDQYFFSKTEEKPMLVYYNTGNATEKLVGETLREMAKEASQGGSKKFATKTVDYDVSQTMYTMAQCMPDIFEIDCLMCLRNSISNLPICCNGKIGGITVKPICYLRYETYAFYQEPAPPSALPPPAPSPASTSKDKSRISRGIIIAIAVPTVTFILLCFLCLKRRARKDASAPEQSVDISSVESQQFDLDTIRTATNDFSPDNKLG